MRGKSGKTMPKPSKSMNTTRKQMSIADRAERLLTAPPRGGLSADEGVGSRFGIGVSISTVRSAVPVHTLGESGAIFPSRAVSS